MTDTERKALALVNECGGKHGYISRDWGPPYEALCRAIEAHEAFKREVSDAIDSSVLTPETEAHLSRFILPKPEPDPLVEALIKGGIVNHSAAEMAADLRAAIEARGGRIVWEGE